jgi:hypothetical protein
MNLLDHFHGPLEPIWAGFHYNWMGHLANAVTGHLPAPFYAYASGHFGFEIDVAAVERLDDAGQLNGWEPKWTPPPPSSTIPFAIVTDELEVRLVEGQGGNARLVGAVEFVSPANKDRLEHRETFVTKCQRYLQDGIGLVIVDVVTSRHANLHNDLMARLGRPAEAMPGHLYATSYRPTGSNGDGELAIWRHTLGVGRQLPTVPLWLFGGICVPADLSTTYAATCKFTDVERAAQVFRPSPAQQPQ